MRLSTLFAIHGTDSGEYKIETRLRGILENSIYFGYIQDKFVFPMNFAGFESQMSSDKQSVAKKHWKHWQNNKNIEYIQHSFEVFGVF